ncbi:MAG: mshB [Massilibacillus sp.]|jgi:LmbE family N-acetylglucosaminyl deacetylase|nr:mshB [Massilibacillus sp.]
MYEKRLVLVMNSYSILLIYAHPDDETVFTGGLISQCVFKGKEVYLISATRGEAGKTSGLCTREQLSKVREEELREAAKILGIKDIIFLGYSDGKLNEVNQLEITQRIAAIIRRIRPDIIVTFGPDGATGHKDHKAIHVFASEAVSIAGEQKCESIAGKVFKVPKVYYVALATKIKKAWAIHEESPEPDTVICVKQYSNIKMKALKCHKTQALSFEKFFNVDRDILQRFLEEETFRWAK